LDCHVVMSCIYYVCYMVIIDTVCNFLEGTAAFAAITGSSAIESKEGSSTSTAASPSATTSTATTTTAAPGSNVRLIYRHYATLYFIFAVDQSESELGILDLIQVTLIDIMSLLS
jgi:hypothetical protein